MNPAPNQLLIISGGQTGADRAALDAALAAGCLCGGWCPAGRLAADGVIPAFYPLQELAGAGYRKRTRQNVIDSDGTLLTVAGGIQPRSGTALTRDFCRQYGKSHLVVDSAELTPAAAAAQAVEWLRREHIRVLNVAGPSGNRTPPIYPFTYATVAALLQLLRG